MEVLWRVGADCFFSFMCCGDQRWGGVRIFQVWVGVTFRSLSWTQLSQLSRKLLDVSLLGRGGGYFRGHVNGINGRLGCQSIDVRFGWEQVLRELLL